MKINPIATDVLKKEKAMQRDTLALNEAVKYEIVYAKMQVGAEKCSQEEVKAETDLFESD